MRNETAERGIADRYAALAPLMDERMRRQWAAAEAQSYGWGGISAVTRAIGMSHTTIAKGMAELDARAARPDAPVEARLRKKGAGPKPLTVTDPGLASALEDLVDPATRGDPQSPLRWTCKSTTRLASELTGQGHAVSTSTVGRMLKADGYSLQGNRKTKEGTVHPDRDAQFEHINTTVKVFQERGEPVISVDTKKKELVGQFKNGGREWRPKGEPDEVLVHDFMDKKLGKGIPYGVYDITANEGWVSVGTDHDTARFAVETIGRWWRKMGAQRYPDATELLITADGGGSNGSRSRLWKLTLQDLADESGLTVHVCHLPPGTSKWNKIEHRMFCHITQNWRGRPLVSHEVIVNLIANTTTEAGLTIQAELDTDMYATGIKVSDEELAAVDLQRAEFHGDWNYVVTPQSQNSANLS